MAVDDQSLVAMIGAIGSGDRDMVHRLLVTRPELVRATVARGDEFFVAACRAQVYAGDTALHAAAFAYDIDLACELVAAGADVAAPNRRGARPLHAAVTGSPGSNNWNPHKQAAIVTYLIATGADPNAAAHGGVTPLHRAVRNRCSAAVRALLDAGADPARRNANGSTAAMLAQWSTGRGGTGSPEAKAEQEIIVEALAAAGG